MKRKIWKTDVVGIGPYVIDDGDSMLCTTRNAKDAQEIAAIPDMITAIKEAINYLSDKPNVLKLCEDDLLDVLHEALTYQEI